MGGRLKRKGIYVYIWLIHFVEQQKLTQYHKAIILQLKKYGGAQLLSHVRLFLTIWTIAHQTPLPSTISQSLLKLMSIESVMPCNHLILCYPFLLLPSVVPKIFSNESALHIGWPKYWNFSFSISPFIEYSGLISCRIDWFDLLAVQEYSLAPQFESINSSALSLLYGSALTSIHKY